MMHAEKLDRLSLGPVVVGAVVERVSVLRIGFARSEQVQVELRDEQVVGVAGIPRD